MGRNRLQTPLLYPSVPSLLNPKKSQNKNWEQRCCYGLPSSASSAAGHVGRHLGLAHHGHRDLIHCTMGIDPILHMVWIAPVHLVGQFRVNDLPEDE
jgi:hypothetical protein